MPTTAPEPAWDLTALHNPKIIRVSGRSATTTDETTARAAAALAAQAAGDPAAPDLIRALAHAGVVAIRAGRLTYLCRETVTSWVLLPTHRRTSSRELAHAAATRAHHLAALRHHSPAPSTRPAAATATPPAALTPPAGTSAPATTGTGTATGQASTTTRTAASATSPPPANHPDDVDPSRLGPTYPRPDPAARHTEPDHNRRHSPRQTAPTAFTTPPRSTPSTLASERRAPPAGTDPSTNRAITLTRSQPPLRPWRLA
ncbi:hypothetical protein [Pseudofrankia asymbiotica]|uniref:Uncharacterized protein n=1 Tax=Pseudofrankia asymbiotica TaxID=1834516 RepID=A0A1V2I258_9ACTN|nr:hypothetical protein [Pseudofrankia asymbiotica]ONH22558.1 hypothetical protein BL253_35320 [Pseudofrankia asymbiotica]